MPNPVRQYIGARYTVKIYENSLDPSSAEWESGRSWEPLILVTYNNSSYMSKKEVSALIGNPAANPEYWVCTGYYNGQIITLQNQVATLNTIVASLNDPFYIMVSTGDTTDRSAELTSALATKKAILFSEGDFYFDSTVTIPDDSLIIGCGSTSVIRPASGLNGYIFDVGNSVTIENIKFNGGETTKPTTPGITGAITFTSKSRPLKISNVEFIGFDNNAIYVKNVGYGHLTSLQIVNCYFRYNWIGVYLDDKGEFCLISNSNFLDCGMGAFIGGGNNHFDNCGFNRNTYGVNIDGSVSTNNGHGLISNCSFKHNTSLGMRIKDVSYGESVVNCMFFTNTTWDLEVTNSGGGINILDSVFGNGSKVYVHNTSTVFVQNNHFNGTPSNIAVESGSTAYGLANFGDDGKRISTLSKSMPLASSPVSTTYTANSYVNESSFNNIAIHEKGGVLYVYFYISVTSAPPSTPTEIGKLTSPLGFATTGDVWEQIMSHTDGHFVIGITSAGSIQILSTDSGTGVLRTTLAIPLV